MPVKIYDIKSKTYQELTVPESYIFRNKREEVRLDVVADLLTHKFALEYLPQEGARQSNFVAFRGPVLSTDFQDSTRRGCLRYLRHISRCKTILEEGTLLFQCRFPESRIPLDDLVMLFDYEIKRFN